MFGGVTPQRNVSHLRHSRPLCQSATLRTFDKAQELETRACACIIKVGIM